MEALSLLLALCEGNHRSPMASPHKGAPQQAAEQTVQIPVIWDAMALIVTSL